MDQANTAERTGPAACDQAAFRRAAGCWATGVAVITTVDAGGRPFGLTMSAVSSLSLDPQQFLICVERSADSLPALQESRLFCINYLGSAQEKISRRFASKRTDKFNGIPYQWSASGLPLLAGVIGFVACRVSALLPGGDHVIVVGDVLQAEALGGEPLIHFQGKYRRLA